MKHLIVLSILLFCMGNNSPYYVVECWSDNTESFIQVASFSTYDRAVVYKNAQKRECRILEQF